MVMVVAGCIDLMAVNLVVTQYNSDTIRWQWPLHTL